MTRLSLYSISFLILFIILEKKVYSQNQSANWFFGAHAGLNFMTSSPTILVNGQVNGMEGCSSVSDASGNLMFYSDGGTIWNSQHNTMANGNGLMGGPGATQSSIIIKQPGNSNIYFIFTLLYNCSYALWYSTVDMTLAAGLGSVTVKNAVAYAGNCVEKIAATQHCNGTDIWVVSHDQGNSNFRAFLVSAAGVNTVAVVSSVGAVQWGCAGQMKMSPTGNKIGFPFELFDFDNSSGIVSNHLPIPIPATPGYFPMHYGCEFSNDGTKFYTSSDCLGIFQWNLCSGSNNAIIASQYTVTNDCHISLQLALNGKIYAAVFQKPFLGVINNPNIQGAGCNYLDSSQSLSPKTCEFGLPNFNSSIFKKSREFEFYADSLACNTIHFYQPCLPLGSSLTAVAWNFGEPSSGISNVSSLPNPIHSYLTNGTYTVQLIMYYNCHSDTLMRQISISNPTPLTVNGSLTVCAGNSTVLYASGANYYLWNYTITGSSITITPSITSSYTVMGFSSTSVCPSNSIITVTVNDLPILNIFGNLNICLGDSTNLNVSGASSYSWSTGVLSSSIIVFPHNSSYFSVSGKDNHYCESKDSVFINVYPNPVLFISNDTSICKGESVRLSVSGANSYTWSNASNSTSISVTPANNTSYTVTGKDSVNNCIAQKVTSVSLLECVGMRSLSNNDKCLFNIFPNPCSGNLVINALEPMQIRIYDILGNIMFNNQIKKGETNLNITEYSAGIYFVQTTNTFVSLKLLKTN